VEWSCCVVTGTVSDLHPSWGEDDARCIGVARVAVGAPATPRAVKKIFSGLIYRKNVYVHPQDMNCAPNQSKSQFLGQFLLGSLDWRYI